MTTLVHTVSAVRRFVAAERAQYKSIGFVPTLGKLHQGHARLIETAGEQVDRVIVSIFVNPLQFGPGEDYETYPRDLAGDLELCRRLGVDLVFAPDREHIYPHPQWATVEVDQIGTRLCGLFRPGHFRGVATVVLKLLNIVQPDRLYMGEKDAQQLAVVRRMICDLNLPVEVVAVPTVRESDGLAVSSRNEYLRGEERQVAAILYRALQGGAAEIEKGSTSPDLVREAAITILKQEPRIRIDYLEVVDAEQMLPVDRIQASVRLCAAVWVGGTRLIDNILCGPPGGRQ